ncbi:MAG: hypothetical protein IJQ79_10375 [Bacteroidales bacterium]|nr:hypothetical protein [Bacteroidales bacterium]
MDNLTALRGLCNAICNTFYPDNSTMELVLFNEGISSTAAATPKDPAILKLAIKLVLGYVEKSRTEGGVSYSIDTDKIDDNIKEWCDDYGLDAEEFLPLKTIENGSNLW